VLVLGCGVVMVAAAVVSAVPRVDICWRYLSEGGSVGSLPLLSVVFTMWL
jgi:hypothetical protein